MEKVQQISVLGMLGGYGLADLKNRNLHTFWMKIFLLEGLFMNIWAWRSFSGDLIWALLPGVFLIFLSKITRGSIGEGDGILVFLSGMFLDAQSVWQILCVAVFFSAICALFLYLFAKKEKQYEMPFVPFLLVGYVMQLAA